MSGNKSPWLDARGVSQQQRRTGGSGASRKPPSSEGARGAPPDLESVLWTMPGMESKRGDPDTTQYLKKLAKEHGTFESLMEFINLTQVGEKLSEPEQNGPSTLTKSSAVASVSDGDAPAQACGGAGESSTISDSVMTDISEIDNENYEHQKQKRRRKRSGSDSVYDGGVEVKNRFSILSDKDNSLTMTPDPMQTDGWGPEHADKNDKDNTREPHAGPPSEKIPPVVLRDAGKWMKVSRHLDSKKVQYVKAKSMYDGIHITAATVADFHRLKQELDDLKIEHHFFPLRSEKPLKVVIKGIPVSVTLEEVREDLLKQGFAKGNLSRMASSTDRILPFVRMDIPRVYKCIYNLKKVCGLDVIVESYHKPKSSGQCHRCQTFGHIQPGCRAAFKCLKCAENHSTHLCRKPTTLPPKCANCAGEHVASYSGCPKNPKNTTTKTQTPGVQFRRPEPPKLPQRQTQNRPSLPPKQKQAAATNTRAERIPTKPATAPKEWPPLPKQKQQRRTENTDARNTTKQTDKRDRVALYIGQLLLQYSNKKPTLKEQTTFIETLNLLALELVD